MLGPEAPVIALGAIVGTTVTWLILAAMLFGILLVGTQGLDASPGTVLAAVAAWMTATALDRPATT